MFRTGRNEGPDFFDGREEYGFRKAPRAGVCGFMPRPGAPSAVFQVIFGHALPLLPGSRQRLLLDSTHFPEPTNNVAPKKENREFVGWKGVTLPENKTAWLTCQVTGYPVPLFR